MNRIIAVTGASSGIGRAAAERFVRGGDTVCSLSRRPPEDGVVHIPCDVSDEQSVISAFAELERRFGRLDVLVNNAGFGISGTTEFTELESAKRLFDVAYFGALACIRHALPLLRKSNSPMIINVGSLAAALPVPFQSVYSSAKAAVSAMTLCLANELRPFGIRVCALLPGDVKTSFTDSRDKSCEDGGIYGGRIAAAVGRMEHDERNGMDPAKVAAALYSLSLKKRPKPLSSVGAGGRLLFAVSRLLPIRMVNYMEGRMYGGTGSRF